MNDSYKIDFHTHILPGMDDGSKSPEMSSEMIDRMIFDDIGVVCATSHFYVWREDVDDFLLRRERANENLLKVLDGKENAPKVLLGAEVAYFSRILDVDLDKLLIQGSNTLLLEMPFYKWKSEEIDVIETLCLDRGYNVVLAHFERYPDVHSDEHILKVLYNLPIRIQINAETMISFFRKKKYLEMFSKGKAHLLGSDCHNLDSRRPNIGLGRKSIEDKLGRAALDRIDSEGSRLLNLN